MSQIVFLKVPQDNINPPPADRATLFLDSDNGLKIKSPSNIVTPISVVFSASTPSSVGSAGPGTSNAVARADHSHNHGNQGGGSLHATASPSSSGFMSSSDKVALDALGEIVDPGGSFNPVVTEYVADETLGDNEYVIFVDASAGDVTLTLPDPALAPARQYVIKKTDTSANRIIIAPFASETIDGSASAMIVAPYESLTIQCNGTDWFII